MTTDTTPKTVLMSEDSHHATAQSLRVMSANLMSLADNLYRHGPAVSAAHDAAIRARQAIDWLREEMDRAYCREHDGPAPYIKAGTFGY